MNTGSKPASVFLIIVAPCRKSYAPAHDSSIVIVGGMQLCVRQSYYQAIQSGAFPLLDFNQGFVIVLQQLRYRFEFSNGRPGCQQVDDRVILEAWEKPANIGVRCDCHITSFPLEYS